VRTEHDECQVDDLDSALDLAADMYDPSGSVPEIVDSDGRIIFDPAVVIGRIMERLGK
jgi:hypothetical protein